MVYVDHNVYNYTKINNKIMILQDNQILGIGSESSCPWIVIYTICLLIYPRCNVTTQALMPPCMDDCLKFIDNKCMSNVKGLVATNILGIFDKNLLLNCSTPFGAFGDSVNIQFDTENCYNFTCEL